MSLFVSPCLSVCVYVSLYVCLYVCVGLMVTHTMSFVPSLSCSQSTSVSLSMFLSVLSLSSKSSAPRSWSILVIPMYKLWFFVRRVVSVTDVIWSICVISKQMTNDWYFDLINSRVKKNASFKKPNPVGFFGFIGFFGFFIWTSSGNVTIKIIMIWENSGA